MNVQTHTGCLKYIGVGVEEGHLPSTPKHSHLPI